MPTLHCMAKWSAPLPLIFLLLACAGDAAIPASAPPAERVTHVVTATPSPTPPVAPTLVPTNTLGPTPAVNINDDCIGCPVVVPGATLTVDQPILDAYKEWRGGRHHPNPVVVVSCDRGYSVPELGRILGPMAGTGRFESEVREVAVDDFIPTKNVLTGGTCYAITSKFSGWGKACREITGSGCRYGLGIDVDLLTF